MTVKPVKSFPPGYVALVERLARLIEQWCGEQPGLPDLRWHETGDTAVIGSLHRDNLKWLANSPDAFRLLEWLDEKTDRKATLLQATVALQMLGHLPGGPEREVISTSKGMQNLERFGFEKGTDTRLEKSPCHGCGKLLDGATGELGHAPKVGDLSVCCYCGALARYREGLVLGAMSDAEWDSMPEDIRAELTETRDLLLAAKTGGMKNRGVKA